MSCSGDVPPVPGDGHASPQQALSPGDNESYCRAVRGYPTRWLSSPVTGRWPECLNEPKAQTADSNPVYADAYAARVSCLRVGDRHRAP
eukprot:1187614-Prorocentrum_minimum.AAC.2